MHNNPTEKNTALAGLIYDRLEGGAKKVILDIRDEVTSTNDIVKAAARSPATGEGYTVIAAAQTAGRGTAGRSFYSPPGAGLYMSVLLRPKIPAGSLCHLTPLCAVAVAEALTPYSKAPCQIKWINDIYLEGRKICGILTESSVNADGAPRYAVVGIGINLFPAPLSPELAKIAGPLLAEWPANSASVKAGIAAGILNRLFDRLPHIESKAYLDEYRRRSLLVGRKVVILTDDRKEKTGTVAGIDDEAALCIYLEDGSLTYIKSSAQLLAVIS